MKKKCQSTSINMFTVRLCGSIFSSLICFKVVGKWMEVQARKQYGPEFVTLKTGE